MKICVFSRSIPVHSIGGMENHCWSVCLGFSKIGHNVKLITTAHPQTKEYEKINSNFEVFYLKDTKPGRYSKKWWEKSFNFFEKLHKNENFDIIFSESAGAFSCLKMKIKKELNIPIIVSLQGTALGEALTKLREGISIRNILGAIKNYIAFFRDKRLIKYADAIITCSNELTETVKKELDVPEEKIYTIMNGVNVDLFKPNIENSDLKNKLKIPLENKVISCVSRLKKEKGIHILLEAISRIKDNIKMTLLIIGDGDFRYKLEKISKNLNIYEKTVFCSAIPRNELPKYYNLSDIFVLPTLRNEGLPLSILEAMACGKPVVVSRIGGNPSAVEDGENGFLVSAGNVIELRDKLLILLSNPRLINEMGKKARQKVVKQFDENIMINKTLDVILKLVK